MSVFRKKIAAMSGGRRKEQHQVKKWAHRAHRRAVKVRVQTRSDDPDFDADVERELSASDSGDTADS